ncbi:hypothetical protein OAU43_06410 [Gammaproteobacteria bacterium]|nr:hypothetical protein [Gammaproteobacteria bacterium]
MSRILQLLVILSLVLRLILSSWSKIIIPNPFSDNFKWYTYYIIFILISFLYGVYIGSFEASHRIISSSNNAGVSGISLLLNSQFTRPFFEYFIAIYYFTYFAILPKYLLNTSHHINYFFRVFSYTFFISLTVGALDFLLVLLIGYEWIPRHLSDFTHVGTRFHGFAGEPRDAFVYLGFGISLLYLKSIWDKKAKINNWLIGSIFISMLLTQSSSGFIGLIFAIGLIFIYQIPKIPIRYLASIFTIILIISFTTYFAITSSDRTMLYIEAIPDAIQALQTSSDLPPVIQAQIVNIYPVWIRISEVINMNFLPLLIGTGLGSASSLNNIFFSIDGVYNPHANIIRIVYENGLIGLAIFINAFIFPIRRLIGDGNSREMITIFMLFILGLNFGHRSSTLFIFFGMALLIFSVKNKKKYMNENEA